MSSGEKDLKHWRSVSKRLLLTVKRRGHLPTLNLSDYAKWAIAEHLEGHTSFSGAGCQCQKRLSSDEQKLAEKRARILSSFSMSELAVLDSLSIKILGAEYKYDHSDRSWADT